MRMVAAVMETVLQNRLSFKVMTIMIIIMGGNVFKNMMRVYTSSWVMINKHVFCFVFVFVFNLMWVHFFKDDTGTGNSSDNMMN